MTSHIYGPVPSRRLGRSLGVDLVVYKTCSYDCIYCQLGHTTNKTIERKEWVPLDEVLSQLKEALPSNPDYITISGSGEPTLHSRIGEAIGEIKRLTKIPVAVLTNGSLLWDTALASELMDADLVIPSLDAYDEKSFQHVNRPHEDISFEKMVSGLINFRKEFQGKVWLEVFLLDGINGQHPEVDRMVAIVKDINPERIQLNTVIRPPVEGYAKMVPAETMEHLSGLFGKRAEVIADFPETSGEPDFSTKLDEILKLLRYRPCTIDDIEKGLGIHRNEVVKYINECNAKGLIRSEDRNGRIFYIAVETNRQQK